MKTAIPNSRLWALSLPLIFAGIGETIIDVTDTIFLGRYGIVELGAVVLAGILDRPGERNVDVSRPSVTVPAGRVKDLETKHVIELLRIGALYTDPETDGVFPRHEQGSR